MKAAVTYQSDDADFETAVTDQYDDLEIEGCCHSRFDDQHLTIADTNSPMTGLQLRSLI